MSHRNYVLPHNFCFLYYFYFYFLFPPTSYCTTKPPSTVHSSSTNSEQNSNLLKLWNELKFLTEFQPPSIPFSKQRHQLSTTSPPPSMVWTHTKRFLLPTIADDHQILLWQHPSSRFRIWGCMCTFKWIEGCRRLMVLRCGVWREMGERMKEEAPEKYFWHQMSKIRRGRALSINQIL